MISISRQGHIICAVNNVHKNRVFQILFKQILVVSYVDYAENFTAFKLLKNLDIKNYL